MKNPSKFVTELVITIIVAGLLCGLVALTLFFIVANVGDIDQAESASINFVSGIVGGLVVGFKLNTLLKMHKK